MLLLCYNIDNSSISLQKKFNSNKSSTILVKLRQKADEKVCPTGGLVSVSALSDVILLVSLLGSRHFLHFSDFRQAEFGVVVEERAAALNGEVVLGPVPQLAQVLVVQGVEGVKTVKKIDIFSGSSFFPPSGSQTARKKNNKKTVTHSESRCSPLMVWSLRRKERETRA